MAKSNNEYKIATDSELGATDDVTVVHFAYLFGNVQTQANASGIDCFGSVQESKQFEELALVLLLDANACVVHLDFQVFLAIILGKYIGEERILNCKIILRSNETRSYLNLATKRSEFNSIGQ